MSSEKQQDLICIVNVVRKVHTRTHRMQAPTRHKFTQLMAGGTVNVKRGRWRLIRHELFVKHQDEFIQAQIEGKIEIRVGGPQGPKYTLMDSAPPPPIKKVVEVITPPVENPVQVEASPAPPPVPFSTPPLSGPEEADTTPSRAIDRMSKKELVAHIVKTVGIARDELLTLSMNELKELLNK